jgi:competence protein ComFA
MREYLLYIKMGRESIQAYVTPCFQVDQNFWQEREGCQLFVMGRTPSLALAFSVRERLNQTLQETQEKKRPVNEQMLENLRQMAVSCVRESNVLYGREMVSREPLGETWFDWQDGERGAGVAGEAAVDSSHENEVRELLAGRALLWDEIELLIQKQGWNIPDLAPILHKMVLAGEAAWLPGVQLLVKKNWLRHRLELECTRCGSKKQEIERTICFTCGQGCAYCTACLGMGRSKCCTPYLLVPARVQAVQKRNVARLVWSGSYSKDQALAADRGRKFVANTWSRVSEFLIWAVCGAGKTELLFPSLVEALSQGGRVLIATPRKDVVLELAPRIQKVFPEARVIAVHGSSKEKWEDSDITIATTHQVMRFFQRFFLVVLDEVDAFP